MAGAAALVLASPGCVNKSPERVKLTSSVDNVQLAVEASSLQNSLSGGFDLVLEVGDLASEDATVDNPPAIELVRADDQSPIRPVDAIAEGDGFPVKLRSGESRRVSFVLTEENTLPAEDIDGVCSADVRVAVTLTDSLSDHPSLVVSPDATVAGCP